MDVKIENSWKAVLQKEFEMPYFKSLTDFVRTEYRNNPYTTFPKGNEIFRAFDACPFDQVKVVILGQDPYPTKGHAHGLCFSVDSSVRPLPKSLNNIFKQLNQEGIDTTGRDGDLSNWSKQGVLLLNAVLTVSEGAPASHSGKGWELFTDAVINTINERKNEVVYILWGSKAQQKAMSVNKDLNLILQSPHPSPLSAHRGFFGCDHFTKANDYLSEHGKIPIKW